MLLVVQTVFECIMKVIQIEIFLCLLPLCTHQCSLKDVLCFQSANEQRWHQTGCVPPEQEINENALFRPPWFKQMLLFLFIYFSFHVKICQMILCVESSGVGQLKTTQAHLLISKHLPRRWRTDVFISMVQSRHPSPFWRISLGPLHHCCFAICMSTWTNYETLICTSHNNTSSRGF